MSLILGQSQPGRRAGLTRNVNPGQLLQTIKPSTGNSRNSMPPRAAKKRGASEVKPEPVMEKDQEEVKEEEDINRPPDSDDDYDAGDIQPTQFVVPPKKVPEEKPYVAGSYQGTGRGGKRNAGITRSTRTNVSPASSQSNSSPKRKSQEDVKPLGAGMLDEFGQIATKNKKQKTSRKSVYGKSAVAKKPAKVESPVDGVSPKKSFKAFNTLDSPEKTDDEPPRAFKRMIAEDSPASTPTPAKKFITPQFSRSPESPIKQPTFKNFALDCDNSLETQAADQEDSQPSLKDQMERSTVKDEFPATQRPGFKVYGLDDDELLSSAQAVLANLEIPQVSSFSTSVAEDDDSAKVPESPKCPMCGAAVDLADLKEFGSMNTRKQERFCRSHQKKSAKGDWVLKGYPEINWTKLDSRISKHHSFIKKLINGTDSHYRDLLKENVNSGKNRNLLKSDFNPTPGYYGTRGLRAISENTMKKFTPLLKKRMVVDRVMAARGFTPYVEYVIVPEVAVLLIMEDMGVQAEEARTIMTESIGIGELVSEEVRDVVTRMDSEEVEDSD